jgi:cyclomaltodextrinase / maltogenic alpha-amylase / neopullulanase
MQSSPAELSDSAFTTPQWVHDAIFYQIFPDRFAVSPQVPKPANLEPWDTPATIHGFKGGDLLGVVEHLDYLQTLGITAIYFCPVFQSTANHRYHTYDYFAVDPLLGGNEALRTLIDEAHKRNIRIVLDGVFNHSSRGFFQFNHILENGGASPYIDWFTVYQWPLHPYGPADQQPGYWCWWNDPALPKFNTNNQAVREYLWSVGEYWIRQGIDGWRLDVPNEIDDDEFWREFRRRVKAVNPDAYIVGEIWGDARRWLSGDQFDAVMNYLFTKACLGFFSGRRGINAGAVSGTGLNVIDPLDAGAFKNTIEHILSLYPWQATLAQLNLLDSHDTARYLAITEGDVSSLKLAYLFQMTFPGAPCIYYGDEIGMVGGDTVEGARGGFQWDASQWNTELLDHVKRCIALRNEHDVLRRGSFATLAADGDLFVFGRALDGDVAIVALNAGEEERTADVPLPGEAATLHGATSWNNLGFEIADGTIRGWRIPARSGDLVLGHVGG